MTQYKITDDLCVKNGTYKDKYGNEKTKYENVGERITGDDGSHFLLIKPHINFAAFPRKQGSDRVAISIFPKNREQNNYSYQGNNYTENKPQDGHFNSFVAKSDEQMMNFDTMDNGENQIPF